ncbi:hypothetical protein LU689_28205 [Pseudomonas asiatica]|uniref:hypothetical protein n=1 Tax=Pseudomonas TaxID=286 RepID=UPI0010BF9E97|nr:MULTISPECIES: hypothetical protein [Pseudomonas]MCE0853793.1 hypothetical protein [Pseudomonas asiatica]MDM1711427.1 hypothetical protein [Pseudomonas sp. 165]
MSDNLKLEIEALRRDLSAMDVNAEARFHRIEHRIMAVESDLAALQAQVESLKGSREVTR